MNRDGGRRRWWRRTAATGGAALVAPLLLLAACGGGGPDKTLEEIASFASTARLAAENRAAGATTARYTRNVLHATHAELQQNVQALRAALDSSKDSSRLAPPLRIEAKAAAAPVEEAVAGMARVADADPQNLSALLEAGSRADEAGSAAQALADSAKKK